MELVGGRSNNESVFERAKRAEFVPYAEAFLGVVFEDIRTSPKCLCPFHDDKDPSFSVSLRINKGKCFACMGKGKMVDVIEFTAKVCGMSMKEAADKIVGDLGL